MPKEDLNVPEKLYAGPLLDRHKEAFYKLAGPTLADSPFIKKVLVLAATVNQTKATTKS